VRGNGKIIQELERAFRGAGWNVIKLIWGSNWDPLLASDAKGLLRQRMEEAVDGEYQSYQVHDGAYIREHFFGKYPELAERVADMSDADLWRLKRGGHDPDKVYAAFHAAVHHAGQPTVILAKTVKGYGLGPVAEGQNITHQLKSLGDEDLRAFRDRFNIPISDDQIDEAPFYKPPPNSPEIEYLRDRRAQLGGPLPARKTAIDPLRTPDLATFQPLLDGSGDREMSTTMAFVRALTALTRDKKIGPHLVPIVADEARTFGMEGMFRQIGIYAPFGQLYEPVDAEQLMYYREDKKGQILQEGITEAGSLSSWIAAGTAYANHQVSMIPFFIFYSMFGFQRVADLIWAGADMQARGFLLGATSGRTTLNGEGLQHQDGHSHLLSSTVPNCVSYDPTFAYELAVILQDGLRRMYADGESVFYYVTLLNENYQHGAMPEGTEEGIRKGLYLLSEPRKSRAKKPPPQVQLLGSGSILREVQAAAELLEGDFGVRASVWSAPSFNELRRDGLTVDRWNGRHPGAKPRVSHVESCLAGRSGPVVAASDYMRTVADQIRAWVPGRYVTLGTDGFGRSDTRERLRCFFEVDRKSVVVAALKALADDGAVAAKVPAEAMAKYDIDPDKVDPWTV
jgi:pyruvate dehydrogenase E1 component